jgi:hypothetical protein
VSLNYRGSSAPRKSANGIDQKPARPSAALLALKFTLQGRRTEKLQSGRVGMLSSTSTTQQDARRNIERNAIAAKFALMRSR